MSKSTGSPESYDNFFGRKVHHRMRDEKLEIVTKFGDPRSINKCAIVQHTKNHQGVQIDPYRTGIGLKPRLRLGYKLWILATKL